MANDKFYDVSTGTSGQSSKMFVSPSGYELAKKQVDKCCKSCDELLTEFFKLLNETKTNAIISGETADALEEFIKYVSLANGLASEISKQYVNLVDMFINKLDNDDDFLYKKDSEKDYTDYAYEKFQEVTIHRNETGDWWKDHWNDAGRWFIQDVLGIYFLDDYDANMYITEEAMKELAKTESKRLEDIFSFVRADDELFANRFDQLLEVEMNYRNLIKGLIDVVADKNTFTAVNIDLKLSDLYNSAIESLSTVVSVTNYDDETIKNFVDSNWSAMYFSDILKAITNYLSDLGTMETVQMVIYNAFGITKDSVEYGNYEKAIIKNQLLETLDDMAQNYKYSSSDEQKIISTFKEYIGLIKEKGNSWYEYLDGRTKEAKELKDFIDSCGGASEILKYGDEALEYFYRLFVDYDKSVQIIDSYMKNCDFGGTTKECLDEIRSLFNKELDAWIGEAVQKLGIKGIDIAVSELENCVPVLNVIGKIRDGIDTFGEITGSGTRAKSMLNALVLSDVFYDSENAYTNALEKVKKLDADDKGYDQAITDLQNCFDFCKQSLMNLLKEMAASVQGTKKAYYQYCLTIASNASMSDDAPLEIPSYETYMKTT